MRQCRGDRRRGVDGDVERARGRTGIAGDIGGGGGQAVAAVGKRGRRIGPVAAAIGSGAAEQRGAVIDLNNATRFRGTGQRKCIVAGDVIANNATVGGERGNRRGDRSRGVDGDVERTEAALVLPATSVAVAVRLWAPLASAAVV